MGPLASEVLNGVAVVSGCLCSVLLMLIFVIT